MISADTFKRGLKKGADTVIELTKVIVPVYLLVTVLKHTALFAAVAGIFSPVMKIFGLPGEAAIVLVLGNFLNLFAGIGAMASLALTAKQALIIALMLSFAHNLLVEIAVTKKAGVSVFSMLVLRLGLAAIVALIINLVL